MTPQSWLVDAIWLDYRLAVALTVVMPLLLLIWAFAVGLRPLIQLLIVYWRVSSLLAVTVYLMIGGLPVSFLSGAMARLLILADVAPTLLEILGLPQPPEMTGRSLLQPAEYTILQRQPSPVGR